MPDSDDEVEQHLTINDEGRVWFLGFKAYASFGKNEITERIAVLVDLVKLVWNDDMFI